MKAKIKPNKRNVERTAEMMYDYTLRACETNNAFFLLALNEEFNFGAVRLNRLIKKYNEVSMMYKEHIRDGFTDEEINGILREALQNIGIDPDAVFSDKSKRSFDKVRTEKRVYEKNNVSSYVEADEAVRQLKAYRAALREQKLI